MRVNKLIADNCRILALICIVQASCKIKRVKKAKFIPEGTGGFNVVQLVSDPTLRGIILSSVSTATLILASVVAASISRSAPKDLDVKSNIFFAKRSLS